MQSATEAPTMDAGAYALSPKAYRNLQLRVWVFLGLLLLLPTFVPAQTSLTQRLMVDYGRLVVAAFTSHFIWRLVVRYGWLSLPSSQLYVRGALLCLATSLVVAAVFIKPATEVYAPVYGWGWRQQLLSDWAGIWSLQIVWGGLFLGFVYHDRSRQLELQRVKIVASAREAELSVLRAQTNPHFFFNSLNTLRSLVGRDHEVARDAITRLAEVMRFSLATSSRSVVSIAEELELVQSYLTLEKLRFEGRLTVESDVIPADCGHFAVPPFVIQILVENAVKYGTMQQTGPITVTYSLRRLGDLFHARVTNPGVLAKDSNSTGVGFKNAEQRLQLIFGKESAMKLEELDGLVIATAKWPVQTLSSCER